MLDKKPELMLDAANQLTAEDLDYLRGTTPAGKAQVNPTTPKVAEPLASMPKPPSDAGEGVTRGERERMRTRESKISTACVGQSRTKHEWWPVGTELVGHIGAAVFTGRVAENARVKSGRSILITSGPAQGKVYTTPSRAALEATEQYRLANGLGRGGGVTNGWMFWKPTTDSQ